VPAKMAVRAIGVALAVGVLAAAWMFKEPWLVLISVGIALVTVAIVTSAKR
jgi:hypothetical protein